MSQPEEPEPDDFDVFLDTIDEPASDEDTSALRRLQEQVALVSYFDPSDLEVDTGVEKRLIDLFVARDCEQVTTSVGTSVRLRLDVRTATLNRLDEQHRLITHDATPAPSDFAAIIALDYIHGAPPRLDDLSIEELYGATEAATWLRTTRFAVPDPQQIEDALRRANLFSPLRGLISAGFVGRASELALLIRYASARADDDGVFRTVARRSGTGHRRAPIAIHGPGGVGKSTLVAKLVLQLSSGQPGQTRYPFAYLSFDRAELSIRQPLSLVAEARDQLRATFSTRAPAHDHGSDLDSRDGDPVPNARGPDFSPLSNDLQVDTLADAVQAYALEVTGVSESPSSPLIWILDTFEVPQREQSEYFETFWRFVELLQDSCPQLRMIICGRAPLDDRLVTNVELKELSGSEADEFLSSQLQDLRLPGDFIHSIRRQVSPLPLTLRLTVLLIRSEETLLTSESGRDQLLGMIRDGNVEGVLFRRVLDHIRDREIRALVHPGLVVRRITPAVIQAFLAESCELGPADSDRAADLFRRLKNEAGVVADGGPSVTQRPELRRILLTMMRSDKPKAVESILRRAADYYNTPGTEYSTDERTYYMLAYGEEPTVLDQILDLETLRRLEQVASEFPERSRRYVASRLGRKIDDEMRTVADDTTWAQQALLDANRLINEGSVSRALDVLDERRNEDVYPVVALARVSTLARLGQTYEATRAATEAVQWAGEHDAPELNAAASLLLASLHEQVGDLDGARYLYEQVRLSPLSARDVQVLIRALTGLVRQGGATTAGEELRSVVVNLTDEQMQALPSSVRAEIGSALATTTTRPEGPTDGVERKPPPPSYTDWPQNSSELSAFAVRSFRYLRLTIASALTSVLAAVLIEVTRAGCWEPSLENYYYGSARAVYVGALFMWGGCGLALKGNTAVSNSMLKVIAGLALVAAITPPPVPNVTGACSSSLTTIPNPTSMIDTSFLAFAIGAGLVIPVVAVAIRSSGRSSVSRLDYPQRVGTMLSLLLFTVGLVWYVTFSESFLSHAHNGALVAMVGLLMMVILIDIRTTRSAYRAAYATILAGIVLATIVTTVAGAIWSSWSHHVLVVEGAVLTGIVIYWVLQALEHWNFGVPTGAERGARYRATQLTYK